MPPRTHSPWNSVNFTLRMSNCSETDRRAHTHNSETFSSKHLVFDVRIIWTDKSCVSPLLARLDSFLWIQFFLVSCRLEFFGISRAVGIDMEILRTTLRTSELKCFTVILTLKPPFQNEVDSIDYNSDTTYWRNRCSDLEKDPWTFEKRNRLFNFNEIWW